MQSLICLLLVAAFLLGGMPIAQVKAAVAAAEDDFVPVLRFMVTSDVHIRNDTDKINGHEQLAKLYETVYEYAENDPVYDKLDAMFFIGDNTQTGSENQQTYFFNYLKEHTKEGTYALASMGNHEFKATGQNYNDPVGATQKFLEYSGYETTDTRFELGGYQFIVIAPNRYNKANYLFFTQDKLDWLKKELDAAVAATPDKPIFVLQHQPPYGTMKGSYGTAADKGLKNLLVNYPQVIDFSGHTHCTLSDPRIIWQGEFTAINTGGLAYLSVPVMNGTNDQGSGRAIDEEGGWIGESEDSAVRNAGMYYIVEVDANDTVRVLTYNMFTESLYGEPFILDSIDPADFVYTDDRVKDAVQPVFASDAQLQLVTNNYKNVEFTIPQAVCKDIVQSYRVEVYQGSTKVQTLYRLSGANYGAAAPTRVKGYVENLQPNTDYTIKVYATSSYNVDSKPLTMNITTGGDTVQADILDVVFRDDGTAINAVNGEPLKTYGAPQVSYDSRLRQNVAAFGGQDAYGFWGISNWYDVMATSYSIESFVCLDQFPETASMGILANLQSASIGFMYKTDGQLYLYSRLKSSAYNTIEVPADPGSWVHLVGTYDGATLKFYVNGILMAQESIVGTLVVPAYMARCMYLGADCNVNSRETYFVGRMASAKLYTQPLTAEQVAEKYREVTAVSSDCAEHGAVTWTPVGNTWAAGGAIKSGHYVLTQDIALANTLAIAAGEQVCIDLAGFDITASGTAADGSWYRVFENNGALTIMDSAMDTGVISGGTVWNNTELAKGGNIYNGENAVLNIYGGTIKGGIASGGTATASGSFGGNIYAAAGSVINIYNGRIEGGTATKQSGYTSVNLHGGNIGSDGTVRVYGGTVIDGVVSLSFTNTGKSNNLSLYGGNIAMREGGQLDIYGGLLLGGLLTGTRTNNSSTCKAYGRGGNISAYNAELNIYGGIIAGGKIQVTAEGKATGTTVPSNASAFGGNVYIAGRDLNMTGGVIYGGTLDSVAKAVSSSTSTGKAKVTGNGGNIYITEGVVATVNGGLISGGQAVHNTASVSTETQGGNIFVANAGVLHISGGAVTDGYSYYRGGNIAFNDGSLVTLSGDALVQGGSLGTHSVNCTGENIFLSVTDSLLAISENAKVIGTGAKPSVFATANGWVEMSGGKVIGGITVNAASATNADAGFTMYGGRVDAVAKTGTNAKDSNIRFYNGRVEANPGIWLGDCACYEAIGNGVYKIWHTQALDGTCATCAYDYKAVKPEAGSHTYEAADGQFLCHCGAVTLGVAKTAEAYYITLAEALAAAGMGGSVQLLETVSERISVDETVTLDLNGCDLLGKVTVAEGETLYVADTQTDDYTVLDAKGYGTLAAATGTVAPAAGYVQLAEAEGSSFHKVDVALQSVSLRARAAGIYYTGSFRYDEAVAKLVVSSGVTLSTENTDPVADGSDASCLFSTTQNSVLVQNILSKENDAATNGRNANTVIFARAYMQLADGSYLYSSTNATYLQKLVETIDSAAWDSLTDTQKAAVQQLYRDFAETVSGWDVPNLKAS
ncbi:MAG: metallophosphoesterase [Oscillospiraceae bacterium]|nr:metallophosphoesterase [Oscillospiraceae bacterium]